MNNKNELISIIVPIYKVEQYLRRCIDSIINQTYKKLEIVLVDDGSPDNCGKICDEYKEKDSRIKVIHRDNGGLSAARNSGLDEITGDYISFIDSDDWLAENAIQYMYDLLVNNNCDVSAVGLKSVYDREILNKLQYSNKILMYNTLTALETFLFRGQLSPCACGKLWKKELWRGIKFPEGKLFEDQFTIYKVLEKAKNCILSENKMYFYYKREGSIGHSVFSETTYDLHKAITEEYEYITEKYPNTVSNMIVARITWEIVFVNMMIRSDYFDKALIDETRKMVRQNIIKCSKCVYISKMRKVQIFLFGYNYRLYLRLYRWYKTNHPFE